MAVYLNSENLNVKAKDFTATLDRQPSPRGKITPKVFYISHHVMFF